MAKKKKPSWRDPVKRVYARLIGQDHINVRTCKSCGTKWDRVSDIENPFIICPKCGKSGTAFSKREKL
jgi:rubrerythrin